MLIIFDVDGTLIGGESLDWKFFSSALEEFTGVACSDSFFAGMTEVTARAIVHHALPGRSPEERMRLEDAVRTRFVTSIKAAHALNPAGFQPMPGARELFAHLRSRQDVGIALATGDWEDSITFKLAAAGFDISGVPLATSSDRYARADIIRLAAERAGRDLSEVIYVGDGLWDFRACRELQIPFLGIGHRYRQFLDAGAIHLLETLELHRFTPWFTRFCQDRRGNELSSTLSPS